MPEETAPGCSTAAGIGKILLLIGVILRVIGIVIVFLFILIGYSEVAYRSAPGGPVVTTPPEMMFSAFFAVILWAALIVSLIGLILGFSAYKSARQGRFHNAGVKGIIASLLPPLDLFFLIGGILCLLSEEAKKK